MRARALLAVLAGTQAVTGGWALLAPRSFYDDFPGGGTPWVALLPPYNEHLVRDAGAGMLALTVALALAAWWSERRVAVTAVAAFLTFTVPHAVFHSLHLGHFPVADAVAQQVGFAAQVALAVAVLVLVARDPAPVTARDTTNAEG